MRRVPRGTRANRCGLRLGPTLIAALLASLATQAARADDSAGGLLRDPKRLDAVQHGCKINAPWATPALCKAAAQVIRLRFRGDGIAYTPRPVQPLPSEPKPTRSAPRSAAVRSTIGRNPPRR